MHIRRMASWTEVAQLAAQWNALAGGVPFRTWEWLSSWWREYGQEHELFVLAAYSADDELIGIAPWYAEHGGAQGRVVRFLGAGEVCSEYLSLLARPGCEHDLGE